MLHYVEIFSNTKSTVNEPNIIKEIVQSMNPVL